MPPLTPEQLQFTPEELSGGKVGQQAYTARIAKLRGEQGGTPNVPNVPNVPATPTAPNIPAVPPPATLPVAPQAPAPVAPPYRIQSGDTLSAIAARQGTTVADLMAANPSIKDPNKIFAGQSLNLPGTGVQAPPVAPPTPQAPQPTPTTTPTTGADTGQIQVPTPEEISVMSEEQKIQTVQDFAAKGIPFEMVQAYLDSLAPAPDPTTFFEEASAKYGLDDLESSITANPERSYEDIVTTIFDKLELPALKADIDNIRAKVAKSEADRDEAFETINENPWLDEATRIGRVARVRDKAQNELNRLQNQLTLAEGLFARGQDEARSVADRSLAQFAAERDFDIETLNRLSERAIAEAQSKFEIAQAQGAKQSFRYFPQYAEAFQEEEDPLSLANLELKQAQIDKTRADTTKTQAQTAEIGKEKAGEGTGISAFQLERTTRTLANVDELVGRVNNKTVGLGSIFKGVPSSQAKDFEADLDTLKANIAFGELTAMREASKTGGALGQVSDRETKLLSSALGALDQAQSPENFKKNLKKIKDSINRWLEEAQRSTTDGADPLGVLGGDEAGAGADPLGLGL